MEFEVDFCWRFFVCVFDVCVYSIVYDVSIIYDLRNVCLCVGCVWGWVCVVMIIVRVWVCAARRGERGGWIASGFSFCLFYGVGLFKVS